METCLYSLSYESVAVISKIKKNINKEYGKRTNHSTETLVHLHVWKYLLLKKKDNTINIKNGISLGWAIIHMQLLRGATSLSFHNAGT